MKLGSCYVTKSSVPIFNIKKILKDIKDSFSLNFDH